ncbi:hypothetical protein ASZ78_013391 [Callipepla squamata]|uniref:Hemicentin-1 n=1 Tax=Callipepla squamata TaxID=9009 RepID=A0A226MNK1_CALSU|nr:hypothetical protein ASZ78_013391 [Callipepla squamata]
MNPLKLDDRVIIQASGHTLQITEAQVSDTGRYTCLASNIAGEDELEFDINIQVPPSIQKPYRGWEAGNMVNTGRGGENKDVIVNNPLSLYCETDAVPPPVITWYKDGNPLSSSDKVLILPVPPSISGADGVLPEEVNVLGNKVAVMDCVTSGSPSPSIIWQKDGHLLAEDDKRSFLSNGRRLQILNSQVTDTGRYVCVVENKAGRARKYFNLNVHVPPTVVGANPENLTVVVNSFISLTCEVTGFPPPDLSWLKNGKPISLNTSTFIVPVPPSIRDHSGASLTVFNVRVGTPVMLECESSAIPPPVITWYKNRRIISESANMEILADGQTLQIKGTEVSDTGQYVCKAINIAGQDDKNFYLNVYVPPSIEGPEQELINETISNPVAFTCDATGIPPPTLVWLKNGKPLGKYTCVATNSAGEEDRIFNLNVSVPPTIASNKSEAEDLTALLDTSITIGCTATGIPSPQINWLKNGLPLSLSSRIRLLSAGQIVRLIRVQMSDSGVYTCVASSRAGVDNKHYKLQIFEPPQINGSGQPEELSVIVSNPLELLCIATGIPIPKISWMKDGHPLLQNENIHVLREGLRITSTQVEHAGRYMCLASSPAGDDDKEYLVRVHVPPNIAGTSDLQDLTVLQNRQITLECKSDAVPPPTISWLKNGELLEGSPRIRILSNGRYVQINNADLGDTANYTCVASNIAGKMTREFILAVYVSPTIQTSPLTTVVHLNASAVLECIAEGVPAPRITWRKDGSVFNGNNTRLLSSGSLVIISPAVDDTAVYVCSVSNDAGEDQRAIELNVQGAVDIPAVQLAHAGQYTCVARNAAGAAHKHVILHVQEPPIIQIQPGMLDVIVNSPILLPCEAMGTPQPIIAWQKEGINIVTTGNSYMVLPNGSLQIAESTVEDAGTYICVAQNSAGTALGKIKLKVQVPPVIKSHLKEYVVPVDQSVTLHCEAEGYPGPEISWHKDGQQVTESMRRRRLSTGALLIVFVQPGDAGHYTCIATNLAGSSNSSMELIVQAPPKIHNMEARYVVTEDSRAVLACMADGIPTPIINWKKDNILLKEIVGKYKAVPGGDLILDNVVPEDSGNYTCTAKNAAGEDTHTVTLVVHVLPAFTELPGDVTLTKGEQLRLTCKATGIPVPKITWTFNNNIIPAHYDDISGHSELVIERVSKDDSGTYACTAENTVGSVRAIGFLYVKEPPVFRGDYHPSRIEPLGGNAMLNCEVRGDPPPTIQWHKNGVGVRISKRIQQLDNGSLAIYGTVNEDAGDYKCVATNDGGVVERSLTLTLHGPPVITIEPAGTTIEAGATAMLNCQASGEPPPAIKWSRQGHPLVSDDRVTVLSNGSLHISAARKEDTSEYECVARNLMGSVLVRVPLTVQVDGNWSEWGLWEECSKSCGKGNRTRTRTCSNPSAQHNGKACNGSAVDFIMCNVGPCPVDGEWSSWLPWGPCSESCGKGTQVRLRLCSSPPPSHGGSHCHGPGVQRQVCSKRRCPENGNWGPWQAWSQCSASCGGGEQTRTRLCSNPAPLNHGHPCTGDSSEISRCNSQPCPGGPSRAQGSIIGNINNIEFGVAFLNATITDSPNSESRVIQAKITSVPRSLGEVLRMTHIARGLDLDGALLLDVVVNGHALQLQSVADVNMKDYTEDYIQTGPGQLYAHSTRLFAVDGFSVPYTWNHTITYDHTKGKMPFLVETLHASSITTEYDSLEETLAFKIHASIAKGNMCFLYHTGDHSNQCPAGFGLDSSGPYCRDEDECAVRNPCSHTCHNAMGTYHCSCPKGLTIAADGRMCQDIDECEARDACQHECRNTLGSYQCACPSGYRLMPNGKSCQDIDECLERDIDCGASQMCFNTRGSYRCIETPCPPNYQWEPLSGFCLKNCPDNDLECTLSTYALEYKFVSLPFGIAAGQDLIRLVAYTQDQVIHPRTTFLMADEEPTIPFALRDENLKGVVFTTRSLQESKTYHMRVRALSYSVDGNIEYQTTFIIYIAVSAYPY